MTMPMDTSSLSSKLSDHSSSASISSDNYKFNQSSCNTTSFDQSSSSGNRGFKAMLGTGSRMSTAVSRSKLIVYLVLIMASTGLGVWIHSFLKAQQQQEFETQFGYFAQQILSYAEANAETYLGKLKTVSNTITSYSHSVGAAWPNVTLPNFDIRTTDSFETLAGAETFIFSPIVSKKNLPGYEQYAWYHQGWIQEDLELRGLGKVEEGFITPSVYPWTEGLLEDHLHAELHCPIWQLSPVPTKAEIVNLDLYSHPSFQRMIHECTQVRRILLSEVVDRSFISDKLGTLKSDSDLDDQPRSFGIFPVFDTFSQQDNVIVGFVSAMIPWWSYFVQVLPPGTKGYIVEVQDSCGSPFYYRLDEEKAIFLREEDGFQGPNPEFAHMARGQEFAQFARYDYEYDEDKNDISTTGTVIGGDVFGGGGDGKESKTNATDAILHCSYRIVVYPSVELAQLYLQGNEPVYYTLIVVAVFAATMLVFFAYDYLVQRRQDQVSAMAAKTSSIVASLFPKNVQKRIMEEVEEKAGNQRKARRLSGKDMLKGFFGDDCNVVVEDDATNFTMATKNGVFLSRPIADYFPAVTIMFGDLVGFTSWSSTREPSMVFILLETIYHEFDRLANSRRIFKVETVGDCYVAVAGLPDPRRDHAVVMAKFARQCLLQLGKLTKQLEVMLGPDTADLTMRIGLHSGPCTAGVLRGDRPRFQLFGDTMNTASRMESTGTPNRVQLSQETADILKKLGRDWVREREDLVEVKGKGRMQTYWLERGMMFSSGASESTDNHSMESGECDLALLVSSQKSMGNIFETKLSAKVVRLVDWCVDVLTKSLKEIEARRLSIGVKPDKPEKIAQLEMASVQRSELPLAEVEEIIKLPEFSADDKQYDPEKLIIEEEVIKELKLFVRSIATMYHNNPFHNFEHASHVAMSVVKLFSRIAAPSLDQLGNRRIHDHAYGITSELTQFTVVLCALIHDVDHAGVSNAQLVKEELPVATKYQGRSVAEQNSVSLSWELLMGDEYQNLRNVIYQTEEEFTRFRSLVVNSVLATDIMDKDLKMLRNKRWEKAFSGEVKEEVMSDQTNRKATIVIEHLMQASDVSHTMQHWHIYRKWNTLLFEELYKAYVEGRMDNDPSEFWYQGEIGFFDFYVIPLAKKLKDCGVFGVSSHEYLQYAVRNRNEWALKGEQVVQEIIQAVTTKKKYRKISNAESSVAESTLAATPVAGDGDEIDAKAAAAATDVELQSNTVKELLAMKKATARKYRDDDGVSWFMLSLD